MEVACFRDRAWWGECIRLFFLGGGGGGWGGMDLLNSAGWGIEGGL